MTPKPHSAWFDPRQWPEGVRLAQFKWRTADAPALTGGYPNDFERQMIAADAAPRGHRTRRTPGDKKGVQSRCNNTGYMRPGSVLREQGRPGVQSGGGA